MSDDVRYPVTGPSRPHAWRNPTSPPVEHAALLAAQQAESKQRDEAIDTFIGKLKEMIVWEPFLLDQSISELELVTRSSISELERLAYAQPPARLPPSDCVIPTSGPHIQSAAVYHLVSDSGHKPRTVFMRLKRELANIDEFVSSITPARVESVYWNEGGRYAFINFNDRPGAEAYMRYMACHPSHPYNWEVKNTLINKDARPMSSAIAEAVIVNGATRILKLNKVPVNFSYGRAWSIGDTGHPRFCHVLRIREGGVDKDFALEFDDVAKAISARDRLSAQSELKDVGFVWITNEMDRKIEGFTEELNGVLSPVKIDL